MTPEIFLTRQRSEGVSPDRRLWFSVALCSRLHLLHGGPLLEIAICREQCQLWYSFYQPLELFPRQAFLYHLPAMLPAGLLLPLPCREPELSVAVAQNTVWVAAIWCVFGLVPLSGIPRHLPATLQPFLLLTCLWLVSFPGSMMALWGSQGKVLLTDSQAKVWRLHGLAFWTVLSLHLIFYRKWGTLCEWGSWSGQPLFPWIRLPHGAVCISARHCISTLSVYSWFFYCL